jgi:ABC-2 type transport system permease protein
MTRSWQLYRAEVYCQFLQQFRIPLQFFSVPLGVIWPYALVVFVAERVLSMTTGPLLLVIFGVLGTLNLGMLGLGLAVARERAQGWMRLKRASPVPPLAHFAGKVTVTLLCAASLALALILVAVLAGHVPAATGEVARVFLLVTFGALPFCALGLVLAYLGGPQTAESLIPQVTLALIALAVLPALDFLPEALQTTLEALNAVSPVYHFTVLTFGAAVPTLGGGPAWLHALALAGLTVLLFVLAALLYRRDEGRTYG